MNRLFISLLRAGDFIMQVPLLRSSLKTGKVHVIVNDEFQQLKELYPEFKFHFFPRAQIQQTINRSATSLFDPYLVLKDFFNEINSYQFEEAYNLSHTKISAYIMAEIQSTKKRGLQFNGEKFVPFENEWMSFFNDRFSDNRRSPYHYLTVLARSLELPIPVAQPKDKRDSKIVIFQCFTSDRKKNWPLDRWSELYYRLMNSRPGIEIKILCTSQEANSLTAYFPETSLIVSNLVQSREIMKKAQLVVCGDTSFAHLAAETRTPVLVLSLGSSDLTKTSPWQQGAMIMTALTTCSPCTHSSECPFTVPLCGEQLKVRSVLSAALAQLEDRNFISVAEPESVFRLECKLRNGLIPVEISLSRRKDGIIEQDVELL